MVCLVGAIAMNYWFRLEFNDELLQGTVRPDFTNPHSYYPIKLLYSLQSRQTNQISPTHEIKLNEDALSLICKTSKIKSHLGRHQGSRKADRANVPELQIERQRGWSTRTISANYLERSSSQFIKAMAGFDTENKEEDFILREHTVPPDSLQKKILTFLEAEEENFEELDSNLPMNTPRDLYTPRLFELLRYFRIVILQDLCFYLN